MNDPDGDPPAGTGQDGAEEAPPPVPEPTHPAGPDLPAVPAEELSAGGGRTLRRERLRVPPATPEPPPESPPPTSRAGAAPLRPDLREYEVVQGRHPGDRHVRYTRSVGPFRQRRRGLLAASLETDQPRTRWGRRLQRVRRVLIGEPISTEHSIHERLTKLKALAVLSSDPLSSVAYATEEILRVLLLAGASAVAGLTLPIGLGIVLLLAIVVTSYRQTIAAYPRGGGSYIVTKDNLGTLPGLTAAASILIDYTLTVAVSISAGIAALYSLFPSLFPFRVEICLGVVVLVAVANLRGVREAGNIFAAPTYLFIAGMFAMIAVGIGRVGLGIGGPVTYVPPEHVLSLGTELIALFLILRAFTQGCTALTGVEAISDGVPAFKPPEAANARTTLLIMGVTSITMFTGVTVLANSLGIRPSDQETVLSQIARTVFPPLFGGQPLWFYVNIATALILVLAANTAFSDFPRLSYFLARDGFMPRQYAFRGDRLAFSWGIITLSVVASVLIIVFNGDTTALIPLYTVGVFNSFTLSQSGMVRRWWRTRTPGWWRSMILNGLGAVTTGLVLIVSAVTKFQYGAWIVLVLIPVLIAMFLAIHRHYEGVRRQEGPVMPLAPVTHHLVFLVPVARLNAVTLRALDYARSLSSAVTAVHVLEGEDPQEADHFQEEWDRLVPDRSIGLVQIESPYRSLLGPLLAYIDALDRQHPHEVLTVVVPESLPSRPWEYLLHNQSALRLKAALLFRPNTVVTNVPYLLGPGGYRSASRWAVVASFPWVQLIVLLLALFVAYQVFFR